MENPDMIIAWRLLRGVILKQLDLFRTNGLSRFQTSAIADRDHLAFRQAGNDFDIIRCLYSDSYGP